MSLPLTKKDFEPMSDLTFKTFQSASIQRCLEVWPNEKDRSIDHWIHCIGKEFGELQEILVARDSTKYDALSIREMVANISDLEKNIFKELADITAYIALAYSCLKGDMGAEVSDKFNEVNRRMNYQGHDL